MELIILILIILVVLIVLKKIGSSKNIWKIAKKHGLKKTTSSEKNCSRCSEVTHIITTIKGQGSSNELSCNKKNIVVTEEMVCNEFKAISNFKDSVGLFGS